MAIVILAGVAVALVGLAYRAPRSAQLTMATPSAVLPHEHFQDLERFPDGQGFFRWTSEESALRPANPGGPLRLSLRMVGGPGGLTPTEVQVGRQLFQFDVGPTLRRYHILAPPAAGERIQVALDPPAYKVTKRTLGVMVSDLAISGGGEAPALILLAGALAAGAAYLLLRQAGWAPVPASIATVVALELITLWQAGGGWVYGTTTPALFGIAALAAGSAVADRLLPPVRELAAPAIGWDRRAGLTAAGLVGLALVARLPWVAAPDPVGDLELAARRMSYLFSDGLAGAYTRGGDYMPLRLYILWGLAQLVRPLGGDFFAPLPAATMALIKLPQLLADLAIVALIFLQGRVWGGARQAALAALAYALTPPVWMNVAWWGQVDALLSLPLVAAVLLLERAGGRWSWACWALALLIKAQAIVFAPVLFAATLRRHSSRGLVEGGGIAAGLLILGCAPLFLAGQGFGLAEAYLGSVGRFPRTSYGAYNLWHLLLAGEVTEDWNLFLGPLSFRAAGLALLGAATLLVIGALWRRSDGLGRVRAAALIALAFFLLPTQIHERYLFLTLPFLALWAAAEWRALVALLLLSLTAALNIVGVLNGFWPAGHATLGDIRLTQALAVLNLAVFVALLASALRNPRAARRATAETAKVIKAASTQ